MDTESSLSEDFLRLSVAVGDQNAPSGVTIPDTTTPGPLALSQHDSEVLDQKILKIFQLHRLQAMEPDMAALLSMITLEDAMLTNLSPSEAEKLFAREPHVLAVLREAWKMSTFNTVRQLKILLPDQPKQSSVPIVQDPSVRLQSDATQFSWACQYIGDASQALWDHIRNHSVTTPSIYANYLAIIQSSGMGKSRAVDEMSKRHFVIPINLRDAESVGYPPADHVVRDFLCAKHEQSMVKLRAFAFLTALFDEVASVLRGDAGAVARPEGFEPINLDGDMASISMQFRAYMTAGTTMTAHGEFRRNFYAQVVDRAERVALPLCQKAFSPQSTNAGSSSLSVSPTSASAPQFPTVTACRALETVIHSRESTMDGKRKLRSASQKVMTADDPLIILGFDEAHTMTGRYSESPFAWSNFSEMRRALRTLIDCSLFSLFLSTTGKIDQFASQKHRDYSARIVEGKFSLIQPYTDMGFDQLAKKITSKATLEYVASIPFIVHLGRPMFGSRFDFDSDQIKEDIIKFAVMKLLGGQQYPRTEPLSDHDKLACLSQRLPIEFNSTTYIAQSQEMRQVEGHLRVCLKVDSDFQTMRTVSASEPLLSEAAYWVMQDKTFDAATALNMILGGFAIHKGDRGELLVMLLLIQARDSAVGPPDRSGEPETRWTSVTKFFQSLFHDSSSRILKAKGRVIGKGQPSIHNDDFRTTFSESKIYFNHFIKVHQSAGLNIKYLLLLYCRGAAILCANNQHAIDGVLPFLWKGSKVAQDNLSVCLWQSKNDASFTHGPHLHLFDQMDPFSLQIFDHKVKLDKPIIRIVFALAAKESSLKVVRAKTIKSTGGSFITYDIWCAGLSPDFLIPIAKGKEDVWQALLQQSYSWEDVYGGEHVPKKLRKSMNPGVALDQGHWSQWIELEMLR